MFCASQVNVHKLSQVSVLFVALTQQQPRRQPNVLELFTQGQFCLARAQRPSQREKAGRLAPGPFAIVAAMTPH